MTLEQVHRIVDALEQVLEEGEICTALFLDVFGSLTDFGARVWSIKYEPSFLKISDMLICYIKESMFRVKFEEAFSGTKQMKAAIPQGSAIEPIHQRYYNCIQYYIRRHNYTLEG